MLMDVDAPVASDFEELDSDEAPPPPKRRGAAASKAKAPAKAPAKKAPAAKKPPAKKKGKKVQVRVQYALYRCRPF
jgi:double-strand break repair protein MRE11